MKRFGDAAFAHLYAVWFLFPIIGRHQFCPQTVRRIEIAYENFAAVITLHEDTDLDRFYMYGLGEHNRAFYHRLCDLASLRCPCWTNADIYGCQSDERGLILATARDHVLDGALYAEGMAPLAMTLETPGKLEIGFRVDLMLELLLSALRDLARSVDQVDAV